MKETKEKILCIAGLVVIFVICIVLATIKSPEYNFKKQMKQGNYKKASSIYNNELDQGERYKEYIVKEIKELLKNMKKEYINEEVSYDVFLAQLQKVCEFEENEIVEMKKEVKVWAKSLKDSRDAFEKAGEYLANENYESAIEEYKKVVADDKNYSNAQGEMLKAIKVYYEKVKSQVSGLINQNDYATAVKILQSSVSVVSVSETTETELIKLKEDVEKKEKEYIISKADEAVAVGQLSVALDVLLDGKEKYIDDSINNKFAQFIKAYKSNLFAEAESKFQNEGYEQAVMYLNENSKYLKEDKEYQEKIEYYKTKAPVFLGDLDYFNCYDRFYLDASFGKVKDNVGVEHKNVMRVVNSLNGLCWNEYKIEGYSKITGTYFLEFESRANNKCSSIFKIYGDGMLLYESPEMTAGVEPIDFSVSIKGITTLKIEIDGFWGGANTRLGEIMLHKE